VLAVFAAAQDPAEPLRGLAVGDRPEPDPPPGWEVVEVRAATVNHHDLWTLKGVPALAAESLPMILGTDVAGVTADGREVIGHAVLGDHAGRWSLPSEEVPGTMAERVALPSANLVEKPAELGFEEAACLPTAYLTAHRMLFRRAGLERGDTVLVQGATGGVASAAIVLGLAAGLGVYVTTRSERGRAFAAGLGATAVLEPGARLPERVDAVVETVGAATWEHSLGSVRSGGTIVIAGATTGVDVAPFLDRVFLRQLAVVGSAMGTREDLEETIALLVSSGARPVVDSTYGLGDAAAAFTRMASGEMLGKLVLRP
jgi:NADPH:quinone reductase-like Zn-dependent oxidoreductase